MTALAAAGLGLVIGTIFGAGIISLAAIAGRATLQEECDAIAHLQYQRGYRRGLEARK